MKRIFYTLAVVFAALYSTAQDSTSFNSYKEFDFIQATNIVFFEDFSSTPYLSLPSNFNSEGDKSGAVEIKGYEGKWLKLSDGSSTYFTLKKPIISDFSVQFDLLLKQRGTNMCFSFDMISSAPNRTYFGDFPGINGLRQTFTIDSVFFMNWMDSVTVNKLSRFHNKAFMTNPDKPVRLSMSYIKGILKLYANQYLMGEVKYPFAGASIIDMFRFYQKNCGSDNYDIYLSNIIIAADYSDINECLLRDGKYISHSVSFEGNTDKLKGESYPVLLKIAEFLKKEKSAKIKILSLSSNDATLSANRAQSIKTYLVNIFKSDKTRIIAEGVANTEISKIKTSEGIANSLRIEFIKM